MAEGAFHSPPPSSRPRVAEPSTPLPSTPSRVLEAGGRPERCGTLEKLRSVSSSTGAWNPRWFELRPGFLLYWKSQKTGEKERSPPAGWLRLGQIRKVGVLDGSDPDAESKLPEEATEDRRRCFLVQLGSRALVLRCESRQECRDWVDDVVRLRREAVHRSAVSGYSVKTPRRDAAPPTPKGGVLPDTPRTSESVGTAPQYFRRWDGSQSLPYFVRADGTSVWSLEEEQDWVTVWDEGGGCLYYCHPPTGEASSSLPGCDTSILPLGTANTGAQWVERADDDGQAYWLNLATGYSAWVPDVGDEDKEGAESDDE